MPGDMPGASHSTRFHQVCSRVDRGPELGLQVVAAGGLLPDDFMTAFDIYTVNTDRWRRSGA